MTAPFIAISDSPTF